MLPYCTVTFQTFLTERGQEAGLSEGALSPSQAALP
jgi:hypothetical protein